MTKVNLSSNAGRGIGWFNVICGTLIMAAAISASSVGAVMVMFSSGAISCIIGMGLLHHRNWARITALGCYGLNLLSGIVGLHVFAIALCCFMLTRLCSTPVEAACADPIPHVVVQPAIASSQPSIVSMSTSTAEGTET